MKACIRDIIVTALIAVFSFFILHASIQSCLVVGPSMEPTVVSSQRLLINKIEYVIHPPERGDIIVFQPPNKQQPDYIKRVIGLPGDTVEVKTGHVYVNGKILDEPYIKDEPSYSVPAKQLAQDNYFVLGDNRNNSNDSHNGWTIPRESIVGKAWLRIWPLDNLGVIPPGHLDAGLSNPDHLLKTQSGLLLISKR
jgi:signal peptidase I